jgi:hypothetical protein
MDLLENIDKHLKFLGFTLLEENQRISIENNAIEFEICSTIENLIFTYYLIKNNKLYEIEYSLGGEKYILRIYDDIVSINKDVSSKYLFHIILKNDSFFDGNDFSYSSEQLILFLKEEFKQEYRKRKIKKLI